MKPCTVKLMCGEIQNFRASRFLHFDVLECFCIEVVTYTNILVCLIGEQGFICCMKVFIVLGHFYNQFDHLLCTCYLVSSAFTKISMFGNGEM
jgi:hypothetical protein